MTDESGNTNEGSAQPLEQSQAVETETSPKPTLSDSSTESLPETKPEAVTLLKIDTTEIQEMLKQAALEFQDLVAPLHNRIGFLENRIARLEAKVK